MSRACRPTCGRTRRLRSSVASSCTHVSSRVRSTGFAPDGVIVVEIDAREGAAITGAARAAGFVQVRVAEDLTGRDRVVSGRRP